ncbi:hypothetical protein L7F22_032327 [Adiantum nelumboides]|nr:hypothetical protein [Adiantum nelumboides]
MQELVDEFAANGFVPEDHDVTKQCASLCASLDLKPAELVSFWELFYLNSRLDGGRVLGSQLDSFRQYIQREQREAFQRKQTDFHFYSKNDVDMLLNAELGEDEDSQLPSAKTPTKTLQGSGMSNSFVTQMDIDDASMGPKTPGSVNMPSRKSKSQLENGSPATPFSQRSSKLKVQFVLNKDLPEVITKEPTEMVSEDDVVRRLCPVEFTNLQVPNGVMKPGIRFMFDRTEDKFNVLEKRIKNFSEILADSEGLAVDNQVSVESQERTFVVGMVCCDGEGHLNDKSVLLQGSAEYSSGHRVRLDLNMLEGFSLFPGQIIGVDGHNHSGHCLVASRIVMSAKDDLLESQGPHAKRQVLDGSGSSTAPKASKTLSMVVAAGPFTTSDNLAYEPLVELLDFARKKQPNLLLLMGPFVDSEHPQIKLGAADRTFQQIFMDEVGSRIEEYCEEMGSGARVVLVPSVRDCHHDFVFPQSPFVVAELKDPEHQVTLLGNPGVFSVNELVIGCCTIDALRHLSSEEASRVPLGATSDRLARLASHIIGQRSFYPLYPPPAGVPLDLSRSSEALQLPQQVDILVTPSDLSPFVKPLSLPVKESQAGSKTLCINPGRLAKGMYGGTFTDMVVTLMPDDQEHWPNNAKVSVIRL